MGTRANPLLAALIVLCLAAAAHAGPILLDLSALSYVGTASPLAGGGIRLTDNQDPYPYGPPPAGAVWTTDPVSVGLGFTISFDFRMSHGTGYRGRDGDPIGGDGLAFVIQNDPMGNHALGAGAGGLGYMYIRNSLAIEFDTYMNWRHYSETDGNHISLQTRGTDFNVPHTKCVDGGLPDLPGVPCTDDPSLISVPVDRPMNDGLIQHAMIQYTPGDLDVYLDSQLVLSYDLHLDSLLSLIDNQDAYVGFTAGTRGAYQYHEINPVPEPDTWLLLTLGLGALALVSLRRQA